MYDFFWFVFVIFSFTRSFTYSMFFVYWRVSFFFSSFFWEGSSLLVVLFLFFLEGSVSISSPLLTICLAVLCLCDGLHGDGVQHVVDEEDVRDGPWHPEATSHPLLHNSWRWNITQNHVFAHWKHFRILLFPITVPGSLLQPDNLNEESELLLQGWGRKKIEKNITSTKQYV